MVLFPGKVISHACGYRTPVTGDSQLRVWLGLHVTGTTLAVTSGYWSVAKRICCIGPSPNRSLHVGWQMELKPCPIAGNGSAWAPLSIVPCERTFWDDGYTFAVYRQGSCRTAAWHGPFICVCDSKVKLTGAGIVEKRVIDCKGQIEGIDA
jgi:hypothetical protein